MNIGDKHWIIADGWIPPLGDETVAFLNVSLHYNDRDPVGPYRLSVPAERMRRVRAIANAA